MEATRTSISLSLLLLLFILPITNSSNPNAHNDHHIASLHCEDTLYPSLCVSTLSSFPNLAAKPLRQVISSTINHTAAFVHSSAAKCAAYLRRRLPSFDARQRIALADCLELFDQTLTDFARAISCLARPNSSALSDLRTVLSAAITNQYTCLDGFAYVDDSRSVRPVIQDELFNVSHLVSNSLAMAKKLPPMNKTRGREAFEEYGKMARGFPKWVSAADRRLLLSAVAVNGTKVDVVVAKDGSGNFTTVGDAVAAAPNNSATRFVIYIKAGAYMENVEVGKNKINLMFIGDGIGKTVVKASRNVVDGWTTYRSATVAVVGNGFLARDITIENSAGPSKHQAVALRTGADLSAFYRCSFVGYQDTLYVHSLRQFYRDCDVYGTVDFIFGNAAVVFQNCNLYARKPDPTQKNIFTAQGREDPNQNTGISIQNCKVAAAADLIPVLSSFQSYLGRPWKQYSRTVYIQSNMESLIDPAGWLEWDGDFALSTLYYGEYMNRGPGSNTTNRVKWAGYRVITNSTEAGQFTVGSFIQGDQWLGLTSVPFTVGLSSE